MRSLWTLCILLAAGPAAARFSTAGARAPQGISVSRDTLSWLEPLAGHADFQSVVSTPVGSGVSTVNTTAVQGSLRAAASDGVQTLFAVARSSDGSDQTGIFTIKATSGTYSYEETADPGIASEVLADDRRTFLVTAIEW